MEKNPYVIAEDIKTISRFGDYHVRDIVAKYISQSIRLHCEKFVTNNIVMLYEKELTNWITENAPSEAVIKTLAYTEDIRNPFSLQTVRVFNEKFTKLNAHQMPRKNAAPLVVQLVNFGLFNGHILLDDIILDGQDCSEIIEIGKEKNVVFSKIMACITTGQGLKSLKEVGLVDVESLYHFEDALDVICQRDFIPGLPFSGRAVMIPNGEYRYAPRLLPWGDPNKWASVPKDNAIEFSKACIITAIEFWEEVYPSVRFFEVPGILYDPKIDSTRIRFVDYLHRCYKAL